MEGGGLAEIVGVVLERHLERHGQAVEALSNLVGADRQVALERLVRRVPNPTLHVRVRA